MPTDRSRADLVGLSEHLLYESRVCFRSARALTRANLGLGRLPTWEVEMALLESFALHVRSLVDFFYKRRGAYETDAFAWHFFHRRQDWSQARPEPGRWISVVRDPIARTDRVGAEVVHLTYHRVELSDQARGWPVTQIAHALGVVLHRFVLAVPPDKVSSDFKRRAIAEIPVTSRLPPGSVLLPPFWAGDAKTRGA